MTDTIALTVLPRQDLARLAGGAQNEPTQKRNGRMLPQAPLQGANHVHTYEMSEQAVGFIITMTNSVQRQQQGTWMSMIG